MYEDKTSDIDTLISQLQTATKSVSARNPARMRKLFETEEEGTQGIFSTDTAKTLQDVRIFQPQTVLHSWPVTSVQRLSKPHLLTRTAIFFMIITAKRRQSYYLPV